MNEPCEYPILFSGPMVRAILAGKKTQTRRVLSKRNSDGPRLWERLEFDDAKVPRPAVPAFVDEGFSGKSWYLHVPYRPHPQDPQGGDWWTTERVYSDWEPGERLWVRETWQYADTPVGILYRADLSDASGTLGWRPSIFLPRLWSRITLQIVQVRVQRLGQISEDDAEAEGFVGCLDFAAYWDKLNAKRGFGWEANPWVWAYTFRVLRGDQ